MFYTTSESIVAVSQSTFLVQVLWNGLGALYIAHLGYKYTVQQLKDFDENELMSSASQGLDTHNQDGDMKLEEIKAEVDPPTKLVMEKLGGVVQKSEVSQSVVNSPSAIATSEHGCSANIQRAIMVRAL